MFILLHIMVANRDFRIIYLENSKSTDPIRLDAIQIYKYYCYHHTRMYV